MKSKSGRALLFLMVWLAAYPLCAAEKGGSPALTKGAGAMAPGADYVIGPGDLLHISVWEVASLTKPVTVLPDGKIAFPLIGQLQAAGRTISELREEVEEKITRFVPDPVVSLEVNQVNSMLVYVIGRINKPGRFVLNTNVNILQALAMAGGLNPFAKKDKIKIFRHQNAKTEIFEFDYDEVSRGERLQQNIWLKRGDVIVVP